MKIRSFVKSNVLTNITKRNEISDEEILRKFKDFIEGKYEPSKKEPSIEFRVDGQKVIAFMNYELIDKFDIDNITVSRRLNSLLEEGMLTHLDIHELLSRHTANMSDVCSEDKRYNEEDIKCFGRVYSCFNFRGLQISISTYLYDKSIGTDYPDEYTTHISLV